MARPAPSITEPKKLLKFLGNVKRGLDEPADTSAIFIKDVLKKCYFWADSDEYPTKSFTFKFLLWLTHLGFVIVTLAMTSYLFVAELNIYEFGDAFCYAVAAIQSTAKTVFMQTKRQDITFLINTLDKKGRDLLQLTKTNREVKDLRNSYYYKEMIITITFVSLGILAIVISVSKIFMPLPPKLPANAAFPFDTTPFGSGFICAYVLISITHMQLATNYALIDTVVGCNYNQIILHFEVLEIRLKELGFVERNKYPDCTKLFHAACNRNLKNIMEEYSELESLVEKCTDILGPFFRFLVVASMIHFIFLTFEVSITLRKDIVLFLTFFTFLIYIVGTFFYWCFLGNRLEAKTEDLLTHAYFSNWIDCDLEFRMNLLRFMIRVKKPLQYHAKPIFIFNYEMFTSITKKAFSYFAILQDLNGKN